MHVAVPTHFRIKKPVAAKRESNETILWQLTCKLATSTCEGLKLNLTNVVTDGTVDLFDVGTVDDARVIARTASVATVKFGPWRQFTIDFERGAVSYVESGPTTEGRGEAKCATTVAGVR